MATITVAIRKAHGKTADQIPPSVLKSLPQDELLDRLAHAQDLSRRTRDPDLAEAYANVRKAMLTAPPRAAVAKEIAKRYQQAARTRDPRQAKALRDGACKLTCKHPPAPTRADVAKQRAIAKAKAQASAEQVAVFDQNGNLVGVCDPADITPLAEPKVGVPNPKDPNPQPPAEAGTPADGIAKAAADRALNAFAAGLTRQQPGPARARQDAVAVDVAKAAVLKSAFSHARSPAEQNRVANEMQTAAIAVLGAIHGRGPGVRPRR